MRVAIFHDYFRVIGGGEKLVLILARHLKADVITTDLDRSLIDKMGYNDVNIITLGDLVTVAPFKQIQASLKFALCNFNKKYDFFLFSGNWAHYASRRHHPNLLYCHTPVRVFYDLREKTISSKNNPLVRLAATLWIDLHGYFDRRSIGRVDQIVANSKNTASRIKKYYGRDSVVVYPPVDTQRLKYISDDGYWLSVNRLYPEKRIDVQVEAFRAMPGERLLIVGNHGRGDASAAYAKKLKEGLPANVTIVSDVTENELIEYYGKCRGFITTAVDEDFGMTAVEAMAAGKPVIAVAEGGYLESVIDGKTGILFTCSVDGLIYAIRKIDDYAALYADACIIRAGRFDIIRFLEEMQAAINR